MKALKPLPGRPATGSANVKFLFPFVSVPLVAEAVVVELALVFPGGDPTVFTGLYKDIVSLSGSGSSFGLRKNMNGETTDGDRLVFL